jgi:uncharacterized membrane protein
MSEFKETFSQKIRANFFYGLMIILPVFATFWLVVFLIDLISGPLASLFGKHVPGYVSFWITVGFILILGVTTKHYVGEKIVSFLEGLLGKIPIVSVIYKSSKLIVGAFSTSKDKSLMKVVLVEYPRKGVRAIGFITKRDAVGLMGKDGIDYGKGQVSVFLPTTPNPTSGYFIYVPKEDIVELEMSVEESIRVLMSAGVVGPEKILKGDL